MEGTVKASALIIIIAINIAVVLVGLLAWLYCKYGKNYTRESLTLKEDPPKTNEDIDYMPEEEEEVPVCILVKESSSNDSKTDHLESQTQETEEIENQYSHESLHNKKIKHSFSSSMGCSKNFEEVATISESPSTVDVHVCHATSCTVCSRKGTVKFLPAEKLSVETLRERPARWWEGNGDSFFTLSPRNFTLSPKNKKDETRHSKHSSKKKKRKKRKTSKRVTYEEDQIPSAAV